MGLFDRLKGKYGANEREAVDEAVREPDEVSVPATRAYARAAVKWQRKRGAGWTRPYRKGREQRHG